MFFGRSNSCLFLIKFVRKYGGVLRPLLEKFDGAFSSRYLYTSAMAMKR